MSKAAFDSTKISDPELLKFAQRDTDELASVLIERASDMVVEFGEPRDFAPHRPTRRAVAGEGMDASEQMQHFADAVQQIIGAEPGRLDLAEALVAEVTPTQLRAIATLPQVVAVRPNRTHRIGESRGATNS